MAYLAILENESGLMRRGIKELYEFPGEREYNDFVTERKYFKTILAPATKEDFLKIIGAKSLEECVPIRLNI